MDSAADNFVVIACTDPQWIDAGIPNNDFFVSTMDINNWDFRSIILYPTVKVQAIRSRLVEESSYFSGLLSGSFSESVLDYISIQWNMETFLNVLKSMYNCPLDVTSDNFLALLEAALYFGVDRLFLKCRLWFSEVTSLKGPLQIPLDDLINIWNFGLDRANDFVPELCVAYLARNFMWTMPSEFFKDVPYDLLLSCIKHPQLTVDSEMHLANALLSWVDGSTNRLEGLSITKEECFNIIKQIRTSLWPLWFGAERRCSPFFSKLATESVESIIRLMRIPPTNLTDYFEDGDLNHLRIRLTEYSEKLNLSGCPQMTSALLFLSVLPSWYSVDHTLRKKIKESLINLDVLKNHCEIDKQLLPFLSFEAVQEVNISKCSQLNLEVAIGCFSKSFPSLKIVKAAYLSNFKIFTLCKLVEKCPLVSEVDLTVDITPVIPGLVSVLSSSSPIMLEQSSHLFPDGSNFWDVQSSVHWGTSLSNITRLTLEGRSDICDSDLRWIGRVCVSLSYLNLKGCVSVTDVSIANLIDRCLKLHSLIVCDTSFGRNSVVALCSSVPASSDSLASPFKKLLMNSQASKLEALHIGGCKGVDEASLLELMSQIQKVKSLCLRNTSIVDDALYNFSGSSLEKVDVSHTMISGEAVLHLACRNRALKCLKARGCRNLLQREIGTGRPCMSTSYFASKLVTELSKTCMLEEIAMGWGISYFSLETLKPAITSLRTINVGLGGSLSEDELKLLPVSCPLLVEIGLHFQVVSDYIISNIVASLEYLQVLELCYCLGDISISSFKFFMPNLRKLKLLRITPWMTNDDLNILTQNCKNLREISMVGCVLLNSDSQQIISLGWPGLTSLHLEDCGEVTAGGVSSLYDCIALEDLLLRHNGPGIQKSFIIDAASKMPLLRQISLDLCDASEADFDLPEYKNRLFLSSVKIARCKLERCGLDLQVLQVCRRRAVHRETLVLAWNSSNLTRTVVKERL